MPLSPYFSHENNILSKPSSQFWLGTDELGRDILSRLIVGARNSIGLSLLSVFSAVGLGLFLALISVSCSKMISACIAFVCDVILCVPVLIVCLIIGTSFGSGANVIFIGQLIAFVPFVFRVSQKELQHVFHQEFSQVSLGMGVSPLKVAIRDGLVFLIPKLSAQTISLSAISISIEGGLSYFGLGLQLPEPSLGMLLQQSKNYLYVAPLYALSPIMIFFLFLMVLSYSHMTNIRQQLKLAPM